MQGSIMDTACIDTGSYEQSIDMGILPLSLIQQKDKDKHMIFYYINWLQTNILYR